MKAEAFDALFNLGWHVLSVEVIGRGLSQWSPKPTVEYSTTFYIQLMIGFLDALRISQCFWVGSPLGGAIAVEGIAQGLLQERIKKLFLFEYCPIVSPELMQRLHNIVIPAVFTNPPTFDKYSEFEVFFSSMNEGDALALERLRSMAESAVRRLPNGKFGLHIDPAVLDGMKANPIPSTWDNWDRVTCPTYVLRGETSSVLNATLMKEMEKRIPNCTSATIPKVGHLIALTTPDEIELVHKFFSGMQ